jgi:hypothetical protein
MEQRLIWPPHEYVYPVAVPEVIQEKSTGFLMEIPVREDRTNEPKSNSINTHEPVLQVPVPEKLLDDNASPAAASIHEDSRSEKLGEQRKVTFSKKKNWLRRFLAGEPPDPRKAERESIPGLVAYFFTGGAPIAHQVLDISANGLYVITQESWYPDTVIRVTLSDERDQSRKVSITLHARVARIGGDGVGLQFFLLGKKDLERVRSLQENDPALIVTKNQLKDFVRRFKANLRHD